MVTAQEIKGHWKDVQGKLRQRWSELTDNEVGEFSGDVHELVARIQRKTGEASDSVEQYLKQILADADDAVDGMKEHAKDSYESVSQAVADGMSEAEDFVQRKPAQAMGFAVGLGVVIGLCVSLLFRESATERSHFNHASADRYLRQLAEAVSRWLPESMSHR